MKGLFRFLAHRLHAVADFFRAPHDATPNGLACFHDLIIT